MQLIIDYTHVDPAFIINILYINILYIKYICHLCIIVLLEFKQWCEIMRIVCLGGGPAGLYFAISMKLRNPLHEVTVIERNKANDTFGWGVVLSDDALERPSKK